MNFPPYWAKGDCQNLSCWRWSTNSLAEAQALAHSAAESLAARYKAGEKMKSGYGYGSTRPLREPVLRECRNGANELVAVVTRNAYGCLVLNTAQIMFVDVDVDTPASKKSAGGLWKKLFGGPKAGQSEPAPNPAQAALLAKAEKVLQGRPEWGWRVYRTRAGFRLLATHQLFDPAMVESEPIFDELGADPLYRQLCKVQKCFRARLTPKPWRCGVLAPASKWPWTTPSHEERFKRWEIDYGVACRNHATCELIATLGNAEINETIRPIVALHDESTRADSKLPLA